ncbi:MAG: response regulator [Lachnospiraceae bacterium]|jgi:two-component system response regulator YesN|nr:response regulator [Lachnospiraceae bacterium]MCI8872036.1 response regulator [Lachnospiraceae bacterium]
MYNIIIADDEKNIREGILELIAWEEIGCRVCGAMRNGEQVLKYLEDENEEEIQLVITDIKMPVMDGIQLAGILHDRYPDVRAIILTAYNEFEYAQQAIKYGVADFVVKNEFLSELPKSVERVMQQWEKQKDSRTGDGEISFQRGGWCRVCACEIKLKNIGKYGRYEKNVEQLVKNAFQKQNATYMHVDNGLFFVIVETEEEDDTAQVRRHLEKFVSLAESFLELCIRVGCSSVVENKDCMTAGKKQAMRALSNVYSDEHPVIVYENDGEAVQYWLDDSDIDAYMRNLYGALRNGDSQEQERLEQEFFEYLKKGERSIEQCKSDVHAIVSYLLRKTRNAKSAEKIFVQENILEAVFGSRSKAGLWDCVKDTCASAAAVFTKSDLGQSFLVENINYIIQQDYKEKLSLKSISQKLFMNSSYISRIYKKETGMTVTDAINKYRMEKAKEILSTRKYKVYEVGEMVGIEEPSYFTHVFMKYEGYSPSEYMNRMERR